MSVYGSKMGGYLERLRLAALEARIATLEAKRKPSTVLIAEKLLRGMPVTRREAAEYLGVSTRKIQRMEDARTLLRCPDLGAAVRYAARDVLRLASAS